MPQPQDIPATPAKPTAEGALAEAQGSASEPHYCNECGDNINDCSCSCSWCGGDGWQESDDPLWDGADEIPCKACGGSGLARKQTIW